MSGGAVATNIAARLGDYVMTALVKKAMTLMGDHFVFGETIDDAIAKRRRYAEHGYLFSYDMLGESARTSDDAERYFQKYLSAATVIAQQKK